MKGISRKGDLLVKRFIPMLLITTILSLYFPVDLYASGSSLVHDVQGDAKVFIPLSEGYAPGTQEVLTVTVTSTGKNNTVTAAVYGNDAGSFELAGTIGNLADQGTGTFTVRAKDGLPAGTYTAEVKIVSDEYIEGISFVLTQVVNVPPSGDATLKAISTIKGVTITSLGTPATTIAGITTAGLVMINGTQAAYIYNVDPYITLFRATYAGASVKAVKYASGASTANFETDTAYGNEPISNNDFFIVKVTSSDMSTVNYYKVVVTVDRAAPGYMPGYPAGGQIQAAGTKKIEFLVKVNESGTAYYVITGIYSSQPTKEQVLAGKDAYGNPSIASGNAVVTANTEKSIIIDNLPNYSENYYAWIVMTDAAGNMSNVANCITITPVMTAGCEAALMHLSAIKGKMIGESGLGTPATTITGTAYGMVTIYEEAAADTTNEGDYITCFRPVNVNATVKAVKYTSGTSTANFETDAAYGNEPISNNDFFIIKVTAEDGITSWYYKVVAVTHSTDATLRATSTIKGVTITSLGTPSAAIGSVVAGNIVINGTQAADTTNAGSYITLFDKNNAGADIKVVKYASGASTENFASDAAYTNGPISNNDFFIVKVTASDMSTVNYYKVTVTVDGTAPSYLSGYPNSGQIQAAGTKKAELLVKVNESGTAYYVVTGVTGYYLPNPTKEQVLAGKNGYGDPAIASGNIAVTANTEKSIIIDNLPSYSTTYDAWIVIVDAAGNMSNAYRRDIETPGTAAGSEAKLDYLSTIKGKTIGYYQLGTPASTIEGVTAGTVELNEGASDETNIGAYITLFRAAYEGATVKAVKYADGASTVNFETDTEYANQAIANNDFFIVKVTSEDGTTVNYYKVIVAVPTADATLKAASAIKGVTISNLGTPNAVLDSAVAGNVTVSAIQATSSEVTLFETNYTGATVKAVKYADGVSTANFETDEAYANQAISNNDFFIVKVTAADNVTVNYYKVVVAVTASQLAQVTDVTLSIAGVASWTNVANESGYAVQLYKDGTASGSSVSVTAGTASYDFLAAMRTAGAGSYTVKVRAVGDGTTFTDGPQSNPSAAQTVIQLATVSAGLTWTGDVAHWTTVSGAVSYDVQLYKNGTALGSPVNVTAANAAWGVNFTSAITTAGAGTYTYKVTAKGNATLILDAEASAASNGNVEVILSSDATLKATSTIKGATITSLGIPSAALGSVVAGNVTISETQAADTTNTGSYVTLFEKNDPGAIVKVVKYAEGASTADFTIDEAYANQAISNNDFFIVRVRAANGITTNYYKVVVAVPTADATLKATSTIKGATITSLGISNAALGSVVAGNVTIRPSQAADTTNTDSYITLFDKNYTGATVKAVKYAGGASTANFETDEAYANQAISNNDFFIVRVRAANGITTNYYKVVVTVDGTAPGYISGYPAAGQIQAAGTKNVELFVKVNESGTAYYVVTRYLSQPTKEQVLAGKGSDNNPAASGNAAVTANTEKSIKISLSSYSTTYDAWIVIVDAVGNATSVYKISVKTPGTAKGSEAKLDCLSTLKGKVIGTSGLGTPATTIAGITIAGAITINIDQAQNTSDAGAYITWFRATYAGANVKVVKYMSGASTAGFAYDAAYTNEPVFNKDFFIVKVTAENGVTVNYYKVVVTVTGM